MRPSTTLGLRAAAVPLCLALAAVPLSLATPALAQEPTPAELNKARTLFREAVALAAGNNCAAALPKYKEVAQIKMTPQVAFNTAECEARLGRLVSALGNYRVAASQAADDRKAAGVLKEVPARIEDLEARIPKLTITRGRGADTATIELDGTELGPNQLGSAVPVDPGTHTIVAKVSGKQYLHREIKLEEKETKSFDVKIHVAPAVVEPPPPEVKPDEPKPEARSKAPGAVLVAAGGAMIVAGLVMLVPRQSALNKLNQECVMTGPDAGHCPASLASTGSQGQMFTVLTEVLVPVGAVSVVIGAVLLARARTPAVKTGEESREGEKKEAFWRSIQVVPGAPGASVGGLSLVGRF